jgi:hypothetical protein
VCECPEEAFQGACNNPCEAVDPGDCCLNGETVPEACEADGELCACACPEGAQPGMCMGGGACDDVSPPQCCVDGVAAEGSCEEVDGECACACPEGGVEGPCEDPCALVDPGPCCLDGEQLFADCRAENGACICECPEGAEAEFCDDQMMCGNPDADPECNFDMNAEDCAAAGGEHGPQGKLGTVGCACRTADGGCPCDGETCESSCIAPFNDEGGCEGVEGMCSEFRTTFGCFCVFVEPGMAVGLCVD